MLLVQEWIAQAVLSSQGIVVKCTVAIFLLRPCKFVIGDQKEQS